MKKSADQIMAESSACKSTESSSPPVKKQSYARDFNKEDTYKTGRWSIEEKLLFLYGLSKFGKGKWKKIGTLLPTRSLVQIKSHAQKVMKRHEAGEDIFVTLDANRDFFDMVVLPASLLKTDIGTVTTKSSKSKQALRAKAKKSSSMKKPLSASTKSSLPQTPPKVKKTVTIVERDAAPATSGRHGEASIHYKTSPSPSSPTALQRSIFQATLGNNGTSVSFSFRNGSPTNSFDSSDSLKSPNSPPPLSFEPPAAPGTTRQQEQQLAAAALCQLSSFLPTSVKSASSSNMFITP
mmetsp:Transcript_25223/g.38828  ORF Transcript_25223/g.38828 Transcript_25223/m.38828 type:complete len:294 (-) Transcript_25223:300-1181(-)|eukprot:CAMPEP_0195292970 /NCGR_PEP_ID=MMETSP0707-20130614/11322_1 /TAXON_ID=33640 /ORGANISM="Asterionellopsis glacialis, Strain CCMP134" /LENGTH=293 /DNA_ID=CAMNT_0040353571 /DNA_START=149 /DNA_END=1030 /DNA_ORIENTATION=+